jgi:DNA-binding LacI/PurR family transcriptional regulator
VGTPHIEVVEILRKKAPVVLMDVPFTQDVADLPMVNTDWRHGLGALMEQLAGLGHRELGLVYSSNQGDGTPIGTSKTRIIEEMAQLAGLSIRDEHRLSDNIVPQTHDRMMAELADAFVPLIKQRKLTAIIAPGESYAISLYENLLQRGIKVPEDVTIVMTSSGLEGASNTITRVTIDWAPMIQTALDVLAARIDGTSLPCREYRVPPQVIAGATMGPPSGEQSFPGT